MRISVAVGCLTPFPSCGSEVTPRAATRHPSRLYATLLGAFVRDSLTHSLLPVLNFNIRFHDLRFPASPLLEMSCAENRTSDKRKHQATRADQTQSKAFPDCSRDWETSNTEGRTDLSRIRSHISIHALCLTVSNPLSTKENPSLREVCVHQPRRSHQERSVSAKLFKTESQHFVLVFHFVLFLLKPTSIQSLHRSCV